MPTQVLRPQQLYLQGRRIAEHCSKHVVPPTVPLEEESSVLSQNDGSDQLSVGTVG